VLLSSNTNTLSSLSPQLSVSSTNNVFAAWHDKVDSSNGFVMFRSGGASGNNFAVNSIVQVGTTDRQDPKPQMTTLGNNIYIAWQTNSNTKLATSTNGGTSFTSTINVGSTGSASDSSPQIAAGTNTIYVVWKDGTNIELARITSNGQTITGTDTIGDTSDFTCDLDVENSAQVAASGDDVYAVWCDDDVGSGDIMLYSSSDEGANFTVKNISQNTGLSTKPQLTVSGDNVFVVWSDGTPTGSNQDVLLAASDDKGSTFATTNLSENNGLSKNPQISFSSDKTLVVWQDDPTLAGINSDVLFRLGSLSGTTISFDKTQYRDTETANITFVEETPSGSPSITMNVKSTTEPSGINISLSPSGPAGTFIGTVTFDPDSSSAGILHAQAGDTITATVGSTTGAVSIFPRTIQFVDIGNSEITAPIDLSLDGHIIVIDRNSANEGIISVDITTNGDPDGVTLQLTETTTAGIFGGATDPTATTLIFSLVDPPIVPINSRIDITQADIVPPTNLDPNAIDSISVDVTTSDNESIQVDLTETGINTGEYTGSFTLSDTTDDSTNTLGVAVGDSIKVENTDALDSRLLVGPLPLPTPTNAITAVITAISDDTATASYKGSSVQIGVCDCIGSGGGGGGLVRPGLVVNVLAGLGGGGGGLPGPTITLGAVSLSDRGSERISMPQEIRDAVTNHDPYTPLEPITDTYEDFDLPLTINGNGFALGGYENTLVPQTVEPGKPIEFTLVFYTTFEIAHTSLNFNLGPTRTIAGSDTQVLLYKDKFEIIDPNGNIATATGSINNDSDLKRVATFSITLSDSVQWSNSDLVIRSWNDNLNSGDIIVYDAIEVLPSEQEIAFEESLPEPEVEQLQSQYVPIWIKNNAAWWSQQLIEDSDFVAGIEYLIQNEIITIQDNEIIAPSYSSNEIPVWIKNNAGWWSEDLITEKEFIDGLQWLISNGIILVTET